MDGIEERLLPQVFLQIAQFIATHGKQFGHGNPALGKMACQVDECVVFITTGPHTAHNTHAIGIRETIVCTVAPLYGQFLYSGRLCSGPLCI